MGSGKKTKHVSSRFLFITYKISNVEVDVEYCPTEKMWWDILNNPKQSAPYRMDCSHLINVTLDYDDEVDLKADHPALLDTNQDDKIKVLSHNRNIPRTIRVRCAGVCWVMASRR